MRKVVLFIACSLDGYIADGNNDIGWLSIVEKEGEDYGYADFINTVDTVLLGRKTYDKVLSFGIPFPHKDKKCYVWSKSKSGKDENVAFYNGDIKSLVEKLQSEEGMNIFCDGGAELIAELLKNQLVDTFIISVIPLLLGNGIRLFKEGYPPQYLEHISTKSYEKGLVQLHYEKKLK